MSQAPVEKKQWPMTVLDGLLMLAVLVASVTIVLGAVGRSSGVSRRTANSDMTPDDWAEVQQARSIGDQEAPIVLVEFLDYECPFCFAVERVLDGIDSDYPRMVRRVIRHLPMKYHTAAYSAAVASECALAVGQFDEMHRALFAAHDSLKKTAMADVAIKAGIRDTAAWGRCVRSERGSEAVDEDLGLTGRLGITATPTILVAGQLLETASALQLRTVMVSRIESKRGKGGKKN